MFIRSVRWTKKSLEYRIHDEEEGGEVSWSRHSTSIGCVLSFWNSRTVERNIGMVNTATVSISCRVFRGERE